MISRDDLKNKYKTKQKNRAWMEDVELKKKNNNIKLCECGCVSCVLDYLYVLPWVNG